MAEERKPNCRLHCGGTHNNAPNFCFELEDLETGRSLVFVQADWDYPGLAQGLGWSLQEVVRQVIVGPGEEPDACEHDGTDGTVDCKACGATASEFISAAYDWLYDHDGEEFECHDYDEYLEPEDADG